MRPLPSLLALLPSARTALTSGGPLRRADLKDLHLQELRRRHDSLEDSCADYEGTIGQFRELVTSLQTYVVLRSFLLGPLTSS